MPHIPHHTHKYTLTFTPHHNTHTPHTCIHATPHIHTHHTLHSLGAAAQRLGLGDCPPARSSPCKAFLCPVGSRVLGLGLCINKGWGRQLGLVHPHPGTCPEAPSGSLPPVPQTQTPSIVGLSLTVSQSLHSPTPSLPPSPSPFPLRLRLAPPRIRFPCLVTAG